MHEVPIAVRVATRRDLETVLALYAQPDFNGGRVLSLGEAETIFATFARYPDYGLYVADLDGAVAGTFCLMRIDNLAHWGMPIAMVENVVVSMRHRRVGIGRAMMLEAARLGAAKGCYKLVLSSNVDSTKAHAFYESLGFVRYGYSFRLDLPAESAARDVA